MSESANLNLPQFAPSAWLVTQLQIDAYAAAAGADDPIHVDVSGAKMTALGGTLAQGMLVLAAIAERIASQLPRAEAWKFGGELDVRFRAPVRPGDHLVLYMESPKRCADQAVTFQIRCENQSEVRVITGTARIPAAALLS